MFIVYRYGATLGCYKCANIFACIDWAYENAGLAWVIEDEKGFIVTRANAGR